jgi:hypothetical protein
MIEDSIVRKALLLLITLCLLPTQQTIAEDLSTIRRAIEKLPPLRTQNPEYCLLTFGRDAGKQVWLVQDGDVLYVDRNSDGDLTEADERIAADPDESEPKDGKFLFKVGSIVDGPLTHKHLVVSTSDLSFRADSDPRVKQKLEANPRWRARRISIDVETPGQRGASFDGRVGQLAGVLDSNGLLQFSSRPEDAPIIHFGAPWSITFYDKDDWHQGTAEAAYLSVGTPGVGPGTTAFVEFEGVVPKGNNPTLTATYPAKESGVAPVVKSYELTKRCCGINLYGDVEIPTDAAPGVATITLAIPGWSGTEVASTTHTVNIVAPKPKSRLEPVSERLKGSLLHVNKGKDETDAIVEVQFSPDGQHLIAGDYDGGVVQKWNVASGESELTLKTGPGRPHDFRYFVVTSDWKQLYAPTIDGVRKYEKIEKNGEQFMRWTFADSVQAFDLDTGKLLREWQHSPPRGIGYLQLSPDGKNFVTIENLSGEYSRGYPQVRTLWDVQTGEHRDILENCSGIPLFSPDGKSAVARFDFPTNIRRRLNV